MIWFIELLLSEPLITAFAFVMLPDFVVVPTEGKSLFLFHRSSPFRPGLFVFMFVIIGREWL